jgi:AraC-like DNA-binding protein
MKNNFIIACLLTLLSLTGCIGKGSHSDKKSIASQPSDTLYTEKAAMNIYGTQPERALQIIDSAELLGNLTEVKADYLRALVYSRSIESVRYDSAILIAERLMENDEVLENDKLKEEVLEVLLNACRLDQDFEQALYWATQLRDSYQEDGKETETLRINAEIGTLLVNVGQQKEGIAKIETVIQQLDLLSDPKTFNNLDATIIALKRKVEACFEMELYDTVIPTAQRMLDLLSDYEQHPADFHDGNYREPSDEKRPQYIDFYRGKAYGYMAKSYASLNDNDEAKKYIALFDQTFASQSLTSRFMIAPTLGKIGEYERMLAIYDEIEQRLGNDTLNEYYTEILHERAKAAEAQKRFDDANRYLQRYNKLKELLYKDQMQSKANLYAARFQAQRQQREIEQQHEATRRAELSRTVIGFIGLFILLIALIVVWQWRKTQQRNRILAQQITEAVEYKDKYRELQPAPQVESSVNDPAKLSDAELFDYLRNLIEHEQLFLNPNFERQILIDRTGLSKERIGAAFAQGSEYERLTTLVRELRLNHAVRLLNEQPEMTIEQVCLASGFANTVSFNRSFKAKYGITPSEFRGTKA